MNKLPKIEFVTSWIYIENWNKWGKPPDMMKGLAIPTLLEVEERAKTIEEEWLKVSEKVLEEISTITTFQWKSEKIKCYLTALSPAFSDPLTVPVSNLSNERIIDILTHELLHVILIIEDDNYQKTLDYWPFLEEKYKEESFNTRIHVSIHAFHKHIMLKLFNEDRWKEEVSVNQKSHDYKRSMEIVESEGHEKIIKDFVDRIR